MLRKKAPFLLKLVLLLAIVPLLVVGVEQPANAVFLLLDSTTQAPVLGASATDTSATDTSVTDKGDIMPPNAVNSAKQVIKPLPSGRIVLPSTKDSERSVPDAIEPDLIEPSSIEPKEQIQVESPSFKAPEISPPAIVPPESVTPPAAPVTLPPVQPSSEPEKPVPAIGWVLLPSIVLGVLLFLWRGRRRNARLSKPPVAKPASARSPVVPASPEKEAIEPEKVSSQPAEGQTPELNTPETQTPEIQEAEIKEAEIQEAEIKSVEVASVEIEEGKGAEAIEAIEAIETVEETETVEEIREVDATEAVDATEVPILADQQMAIDAVEIEHPTAVVSEVSAEKFSEVLVEAPPKEQADEIVEEILAEVLDAQPEVPTPNAATPLPRFSNLTPAGFQKAFLAYLLYFQGKTLETATLQECYAAFVRLIHEGVLVSPDLSTPETKLAQSEGKLVAEIIPVPIAPLPLEATINNLGILSIVESALQELGLSLSQLSAQHQETAFSQSQLGSLMVGYLEALATAEVAAIGYGLRYITAVEPEIRHGWQVEVPINQAQQASPWQWQRPDLQIEVNFGGQTHAYLDEQQHYRVRWIPDTVIIGIPCDVPIAGYKNNSISLLRLWQPDSTKADSTKADSTKTDSTKTEEFANSGLELCFLPETLSNAIPDHERTAWRLKQTYFLVACAVQDMLRLHFQAGGTPNTVAQRLAVQLNEADTALAIAELMRLLLDEYSMAWEQAWEMTQQTFSYTQHNVLLASVNQLYSLELFANLLPRHLEIIYEVNARFLNEVRDRYPGEIFRLRHMSLIDEQGERYVRLPYLACLGSHAVTSSSQLQSQILQKKSLKDFYQVYPEKFSTIRSGITPRFNLLCTNPELSNLICDKIGDGWITDLQELSKLTAYEEEVEFVQRWRQIKQAAKQSLVDRIHHQYEISVDAHSLFDVQALEFKPTQRHALNLLHSVTLYQRLKANPALSLPARTVMFAGIADPHDEKSKLLIKAIHSVAEVINADPVTAKTLKLVYFDSYTPSFVQDLYRAADIAEFLAVPSIETSTINPLFAVMNGSLILGAANGLNLELADAMGANNLFLFGMTPARTDWQSSDYQPHDFYETNSSLRNAIDQLASGFFSNGEVEWLAPLIDSWFNPDPCILLADYQPYLECQDRVSQAYRDPMGWTRISILNTIKIGSFSADRTVQEYCLKIWKIKPAA